MLVFLLMGRRAPRSTIFPYTTLFRSRHRAHGEQHVGGEVLRHRVGDRMHARAARAHAREDVGGESRSEEHTSELQSLRHLGCRLLLEKKKCEGQDEACCAEDWMASGR